MHNMHNHRTGTAGRMEKQCLMMRSLLEMDIMETRALHEQCFPIKYPDTFYKASCTSEVSCKVAVSFSSLYTSVDFIF